MSEITQVKISADNGADLSTTNGKVMSALLPDSASVDIQISIDGKVVRTIHGSAVAQIGDEYSGPYAVGLRVDVSITDQADPSCLG